MNIIVELLQSFVMIFLASAPWLLLGFCIAGVINLYVPIEFLHRHLGKNNAASVLKGAFLGAPLPLCSCGVIPAALGLRQTGASKASTTSFLIATPETGVDSVSITYALLGPMMAIIRPIAALSTAITAGILVLWSEKYFKDDVRNETDKAQSSCCSSKSIDKPELEEPSCCGVNSPDNHVIGTGVKRFIIDMNTVLHELLEDIAVWLLIGIGMAAFIMTVVPESYLAEWGSSSYAYIIMAAIGIPMYICATSSTPIAAGLVAVGVSPGAVLVFLLVGPATNLATLAIVKNVLGKRVLMIYLSTVVLVSFIFGWFTDFLSKDFLMVGSVAISRHDNVSVVMIVSAVILTILLGNCLKNIYTRKYK